MAAVLDSSLAERKIRLTLHGDSVLSKLQFLKIAEADENGSFRQPRHSMRFSRMLNLHDFPGLFAFLCFQLL